jgi:murein DD-endopeptidase MepM/ murein hydrolase activator NlpD
MEQSEGHQRRERTLPTPEEEKRDVSFSFRSPSASLSSVNEVIGSFPNISPVEGWVTRKFSPDTSDAKSGHLGVDFAAAHGTPIRATAPGVVGKIENDKYFGWMVTIYHDYGFVTRYGHCSQVLVSKHDRVHRGQTIALVGNTGRSTAPHLHYEVLKDGKHIDPLKHIIVHKDH